MHKLYLVFFYFDELMLDRFCEPNVSFKASFFLASPWQRNWRKAKTFLCAMRFRSAQFILNEVVLGYIWWSRGRFDRWPSSKSSSNPRSPAVVLSMLEFNCVVSCDGSSTDIHHDLLASSCDQVMRHQWTEGNFWTWPFKFIWFFYDASRQG